MMMLMIDDVQSICVNLLNERYGDDDDDYDHDIDNSN